MKIIKYISVFLIICGLTACGKQDSEPMDLTGYYVLNEADSEVTLTLISDLRCPACKKFRDVYFDEIYMGFIQNQQVQYQSIAISFTGLEGDRLAALLKVIELNTPENYIAAYKLAYQDDIFGSSSEEFAKAIVSAGLYDGSVINLLKEANSESVRQLVQTTKQQLIAQGVRSVPTLLVNGKPITYNSISDLNSKITTELNNVRD